MNSTRKYCTASTVTSSAPTSRAEADTPDAPPAIEANTAVEASTCGDSRSTCPMPMVTSSVSTTPDSSSTGWAARVRRRPASNMEPAATPMTAMPVRRPTFGRVISWRPASHHGAGDDAREQVRRRQSRHGEQRGRRAEDHHQPGPRAQPPTCSIDHRPTLSALLESPAAVRRPRFTNPTCEWG
ncbi:hypothetical protein BJF85_03770 [Saccharomonospora sp. CUA-673]|nr:hypothetical protein BJF85_03770 [Saccharomonospora sp. CUA-673]